MRGIQRAVGAGVVSVVALLSAGCGSGGGGGGGGGGLVPDPVPVPAPESAELVSLQSEGGVDSPGGAYGGITVSASASFSDGSFVRVGTCWEDAVFAPGEPGERRMLRFSPPCLYLARHHADGSLAWVRFCVTNSLVPDAPSSVIALPDGGAVFTGRRADSMQFEQGAAGGMFILDRGTDGSFTAAYDAGGNLEFARESLAATWGAKLAPAEGGSEYAMVVTVDDEIGIAPDEGMPAQFEPLSHTQSVAARFESATGNFRGWQLLDGGGDTFADATCGTSEGGFAVGGRYGGAGFLGLQASDSFSDGYLLRFDGKSQSTWSRRVLGREGQSIDALASLPGGGLVVEGTYGGSGCDFEGAASTLHLQAFAGGPVTTFLRGRPSLHQFVCVYDAAGEPTWPRTPPSSRPSSARPPSPSASTARSRSSRRMPSP